MRLSASIYDLPNTLGELKAFYDDLLPPLYTNGFPSDFELAPSDWYLHPDKVHRKICEKEHASIRPIGTLDVEFLNDGIIADLKKGVISLAGNYPCGLKCPGCFSEDRTYLDAPHLMTWREMFRIIDEARTIGLSSIKFLGPGELLQNPDLFDILDAAEERKLPLSIFTKGAELGDDSLAEQTFGPLGIRNAADLVQRISQYSCVRILLGFNSFDPRRQDRITGSYGVTGNYVIRNRLFEKRGVEKYTEKRNRALTLLCGAGFNNPTRGQRLSLIAAPVGLDQAEEITEMYVWAARRNIPLVIAPTMESGPKSVGLMRYNKRKDPDHEKLRCLYISVYSRAIEEGITSLNQIEWNGISAYMGTAACNQVANGLFVRLNGQVQMCPGSHSP